MAHHEDDDLADGAWVRPMGVSPLAEDAANGPKGSVPPNGADYMRQALKTFEERNKVYKDTHTMHGNVLKAMFPKGIFLHDAVEHSRYVTFNQIVGKLCRYATNFTDGGHQDSIHDVGVYAFILEAIDSFDQATKS